MYLIFNSVLSPESDFGVRDDNRAFQYGDGLFETLRYQQGCLAFWPDHYDRLARGMAALKLDRSDLFTADNLFEQVTALLAHNGLAAKTARVKIQVWRQPGGLYTPTSRAATVLITARPGQPFAITEKENIGIFEDVRLTQSSVSAFKTTSALPYVLAGLAKQEGGFGDMILLDTYGHLAECVASALFWFRDDTLFMPSLETGCIDGILRRQLRRLAPGAGFTVKEGLFLRDELAGAAAIYCGNVMGIQRLKTIRGVAVQEQNALLPHLDRRIKALFNQLL